MIYIQILAQYLRNSVHGQTEADTVKPVYNDHLSNKIYYLRFIQ